MGSGKMGLGEMGQNPTTRHPAVTTSRKECRTFRVSYMYIEVIDHLG